VVCNSDALLDKLYETFNGRVNDGESFLKFDHSTYTVWYLRFIHLLINISKENDDRQPLIDYLKSYYANSPKQFEDVRKFEFEYSPLAAIDWYTKDSFVYRTLNKAFRLFNFEILFLFRFFIADLCQQLSSLRVEKNISVDTVYYRGQIMYRSEIETLERNQHICSTSFLSTTRSRDIALKYFTNAFNPRRSTRDPESVLFVIHPAEFNYERLIFADISEFSNFGNAEQEVLFAVGSYFRIDRISFDEDNDLWTIQIIEQYVEEKLDDLKRPFYIDIISIGFYLLVEDDDFQCVQSYYEILSQKSNSPLWIISCHVGIGLIEYYKKNYLIALEKFKDAMKIIDEENLGKTCEIIANIYCVVANVYREMADYDKALDFYKKALKTNKTNYFIAKKHSFWDMYIYKSKLNPFVKNDKYFYYCDRIFLNMMVLYKITEQWTLAMDIYEKIWNNYYERNWTGEVEVFVKILGHTGNNGNLRNLIDENRKFLGGKTISRFVDKHQKHNVLYAYAKLADHYSKFDSLDYAFLYYQEVLQLETKIEPYLTVRCLYGIAKVYEMSEDYSSAINWLKQAVVFSINGTSEIGWGLIDVYKKCLIIFNEKLKDTSTSIGYMKEIINNLVENTDDINSRNDLIVEIYKTAIQFYQHNDKTKIESICDHIHQVLDKVKINEQGWKKWLCIGSTCVWETFWEEYHNCKPIIDENNIVYWKLYQKIFAMLSRNSSNELQNEIDKCKHFLNRLEYSQLDFKNFVLK
jgi:tetratricopeptide (TPR) repeat protein